MDPNAGHKTQSTHPTTQRQESEITSSAFRQGQADSQIICKNQHVTIVMFELLGRPP